MPFHSPLCLPLAYLVPFVSFAFPLSFHLFRFSFSLLPFSDFSSSSSIFAFFVCFLDQHFPLCFASLPSSVDYYATLSRCYTPHPAAWALANPRMPRVCFLLSGVLVFVSFRVLLFLPISGFDLDVDLFSHILFLWVICCLLV